LPTSVLSAIKHYAKRGAILLYKLALTQKQIYKLKAAAKATAYYKQESIFKLREAL
jgi:hypothetical protein